MIKAVLEHPAGSVDLYEGETVIGRGLGCQVRFNHHTVSRRHLALIVRGDEVMAKDLESRNGTKVNDVPLEGPVVLEDGDVLQLGSVRLRITLGASRPFMDEVVTSPGSWAPTGSDPSLRAISVGGWGSKSTPSARSAVPTAELPTARSRGLGGLGTESRPIKLVSDPQELALPDEVARTCPDCRTLVSITQEQCAICGYQWQHRGPLSKTQPLIVVSPQELGSLQDDDVSSLDRRTAYRQPIAVPVIYHSPNLSFDAVAQNLSRSGMFITSDLLDAEGTRCVLRVLPDGGPAVSIGGVVRHVVTATSEGDPHPGMGIRFTKMNEAAIAWTWSVLESISPD